MSSRRSHRALPALVALALAAGCSGGSTPEGWVEVADQGMRFDVPQDWVETGELNERWTRAWQDVEGDAAQVQLAAAPDVGFYDALAAQGVLMSSAQIGGLPGYSVVKNHDEEELGRSWRELTRLDFTYEPEDGVQYEGVLWTASLDRQHPAVALQVTGAELDPDVVAHLQESLEVVATDDQG
ncbi:hypothetical protein Cfla_2556 [Cellulomonas flavigena DSM 20109]|uniref:Lipoprotein n=1 Tax=Cellulomonas flavigena (strain ATCC 482 / DSM 20109 / BCRC 11376 / JCM 18109 / NBRC 3775 / NCIMB 8073 / NRS 134) TaxID=446466 RepID=D5UI99_CELFN|nr:hypothetical protein [Cellulomonas flavigena]ADG75444.1 hypothetical protein Cfla_2556 [Cellulomonas flavigena DSM 20109]